MKIKIMQYALPILLTIALSSATYAMESTPQEKTISEGLIHLSESNASLEKYNELTKKYEEVDQKRKIVQFRSHEKVKYVLLMTSEEARGLAYKFADKMDTRIYITCKLAASTLNKDDCTLQNLIKDLNTEKKCHSESLQRLEKELMACTNESSKKEYFSYYNMAKTYYPHYKNETTIETGHYLFFTIIELYSLQKIARYEKLLKDIQIEIAADQGK